MSDPHGPIWIVEEPAQPYPDGRFDELWMADPILIGVDHPHYKPPLDPQQPTSEQIADAARLAADDIATVFRKWGYIQTHPLPRLRALLDMLTPPATPAPKWETMLEDMDAARQFVAEWQAKEKEDE